MSYIVRFRRPEKEIPAWLLAYQPESPAATVNLRDLQQLAERAAREHPVLSCWASNAGGMLHIILAGKGFGCQHRIDVHERDNYESIMARVRVAATAHVDDCAGRKGGKPHQLALFA